MDGGAGSSPPLHVVIFPWLAFGHLLPGLELAERLASRGHRVSFISTPRNISRLRPVPPPLAAFLKFVPFQLPRVHGLPDGAEATSDVPPGESDLHMKAFDALAAPFSAFLDDASVDNKVDWLVVDSFHYWAAAAAHDRKIPCVLSMTYSAATSVQYGLPRGVSTAVNDLSGPSIVQRLVLTFEKCKLLAHRSCFELEPESMPLLSDIFGKPVVPVGLLPPPPASGEDPGDRATLSWLDKQADPKSVVYVAFGSEAPLTVAQLHEIALGLELAGTRFLWALRKPHGVPEDGILPSGFEERTRGRGLVVMGWVPQLSILAHGAVGAFVTHCGWSSTIEGLLFGHPLIMLPFLGEQGINARLMEKKQVGMKVPRHGTDGSFDRYGIATTVRGVMSEEGGRVLAANAKKLQEVVKDKECHDRYIDEFVQHLRSYAE
jgi:UDP:flavonoid glycosyltransferase YjiC (YdhE family)